MVRRWRPGKHSKTCAAGRITFARLLRTPCRAQPALGSIAAAGVLCALFIQPAVAQTVKVTPLGGIDGEFCAQDRALVFEDPNGTRVLYDPGHTVAGGTDPRLGKIDVVLVSHMHADHVGEAHIKASGAGSCARPDLSVPTPDTNVVDIALAKKARIVTGSEMPPFFAARLKKGGGDPAASMLARFGGSVTVDGVRIATVAAASGVTDAKEY